MQAIVHAKNTWFIQNRKMFALISATTVFSGTNGALSGTPTFGKLESFLA
jgi:hypothetical protein